MTCRLCGGPNHPVFNCMTFVRVAQPLKDAIKLLWDRDPQHIEGGATLANWIYDNVYAPNTPHNPQWVYYFGTGDPTKLVHERIYMSIQGHSVLKVWNAIQPYFNSGLGLHGVIQAKHCSAIASMTRPDSIVIYLRDRAAVIHFCNELRRLRRNGLIADSDFKSDSAPGYGQPRRTGTPPGTGHMPDLPGVSTAPQPENPGDSFGTQLCRILSETFDEYNRPVRIPMLDFMVFCLDNLKQQGIDIMRPWRQPNAILIGGHRL